MEGLIAKKIGMTQVYDAEGNRTCVTVLECGPCPVVQLKTLENDGYVAAQLGFGPQKAKRLAKAQQKQARKAEEIYVKTVVPGRTHKECDQRKKEIVSLLCPVSVGV